MEKVVQRPQRIGRGHHTSITNCGFATRKTFAGLARCLHRTSIASATIHITCPIYHRSQRTQYAMHASDRPTTSNKREERAASRVLQEFMLRACT